MNFGGSDLSRFSLCVSFFEAATAFCSSSSDGRRSHWGTSFSRYAVILLSCSGVLSGKRTLLTVNCSICTSRESLSARKRASNQTTPNTGVPFGGSHETAMRPERVTPSMFSSCGW